MVKCWYKVPPCAGCGEADEDCCDWLEVTIVDILLLLLLLLLVGKLIPGTVAGKGTETTKLSACCCLSSFTTVACDFACTFWVITWDLLLFAVTEVVDVWVAVSSAVDPVDCITFGLTFCILRSVDVDEGGGALAALLVDDVEEDELFSVRA